MCDFDSDSIKQGCHNVLQVVRELRRAGGPYSTTRLAVLGAREQLCTNPKVSKMTSTVSARQAFVNI